MKIDIGDEVDLSTAFDMALRITYDINVPQSTACTESKPLMVIQFLRSTEKEILLVISLILRNLFEIEPQIWNGTRCSSKIRRLEF